MEYFEFEFLVKQTPVVDLITIDNKNMLSPKVSIIIPSFNKEKYISETINSVLNQNYTEWELLIIDDKSIDKTVKIAQSFSSKDNRIKIFVNPENKGANFSRNFGLKNAVAKYVVFLDADDVLSNTCLQNRINKIENTDFDFCVFSMGTFYKKIGDSSFRWLPSSNSPLKDFLNHKLPWSILQPIWVKSYLIKIGGFDEKFKRLQDVELHTRALLYENVKFRQFVNEPDCFYRIDEGRKNYNTVDFLNRWIESANAYCNKFYLTTKNMGLHKKLFGTIYKTFLQLLYCYKTKKITKMDFNLLKAQLLNANTSLTASRKAKFCFALANFFNLLPFRLPGINALINKILTSN